VSAETFLSERDHAEAMFNENGLRYANEASDYGWSYFTGNCGACGDSECHPGRLCDRPRCQRCPSRKDRSAPGAES